MSIIDRIDTLLKKNNLSGAQMSKALGFSSGVYSQWKSSGSTPSGKSLLKIADYFNVTVDYLLTGAGVLGDAPPEHYEQLALGLAKATGCILPDEINEFSQFIDKLGFKITLDDKEGYLLTGNTKSTEAKTRVPISADELKTLVRSSQATVQALVTSFVVGKKDTP